MSLKKSDQAGISFSIKLNLLYTFFFIISSISLFIIAYYIIANILDQREKELISVRLQEYQAWYREGGIYALKNRFYAQADSIKDAYFIRILSPSNNVLFISIPEQSERFDIKDLNQVNPYQINNWHILKSKSNKNVWNIVSTPLQHNIILQIGKRNSQSYELLNYLRTVFLWFVIPILLLGLAASSLITFRAIRPIREIIQTVQKILNTGQISERVAERNESGELAQLAKLFNKMLTRNESLIQAMGHSIDNVAHDLRTPMTRLRGIAELALRNPDDHQGCLEALADCMEESEHAVEMLNILMNVSEAESGAMQLNFQTIQLSELIQSVCDLYEFVAEDLNINLSYPQPCHITISVDKIRLQQALANLVDNALKYSRENTMVQLTCVERDTSVEISVKDEGMGIPGEDISRIWERLYRGDSSRSQKGMGLGLSFVKAIVEAHSGSVNVTSQINKGSTFKIQLPKV